MRVTILLAAPFALASALAAFAQSAAPASDPDAGGKRVFRKANCMGCHKWDGSGGGGYGGAALSLRATVLDRQQIMMTVTCGRPGTGMPYHLRGAYDDPAKPCYGLSRAEAGTQMPPEPATYLRGDDVASVAAYVIDVIKGKSETTFADCTMFWGQNSRVCDIYKNAAHETAQPGGR